MLLDSIQITGLEASPRTCCNRSDLPHFQKRSAVPLQIAGAIFFRYPLLWQKQKPPVYTAFGNLLSSLYPKGEAFTSFLNSIGELHGTAAPSIADVIHVSVLQLASAKLSAGCQTLLEFRCYLFFLCRCKRVSYD
jgi:hypothetical protein